MEKKNGRRKVLLLRLKLLLLGIQTAPVRDIIKVCIVWLELGDMPYDMGKPGISAFAALGEVLPVAQENFVYTR